MAESPKNYVATVFNPFVHSISRNRPRVGKVEFHSKLVLGAELENALLDCLGVLHDGFDFKARQNTPGGRLIEEVMPEGFYDLSICSDFVLYLETNQFPDGRIQS